MLSVPLHCPSRSEDGEQIRLKELFTFVIVYNLVRLVMLEAGRRHGVPVERISFVDALGYPPHRPA